jgi:hypothetical protein
MPPSGAFDGMLNLKMAALKQNYLLASHGMRSFRCRTCTTNRCCRASATVHLKTALLVVLTVMMIVEGLGQMLALV